MPQYIAIIIASSKYYLNTLRTGKHFFLYLFSYFPFLALFILGNILAGKPFNISSGIRLLVTNSLSFILTCRFISP